MKNVPPVLALALVVMVVEGRGENVREEALRLIAADVKSGGKSVPKGPKPVIHPLPGESENKQGEEREVLILPKVEVTAPKVTPFEKKLEELDEETAWEERSTKLSWLEALLNGKGFANARVKRARERVEIMSWERLLLVALVAAKTDEERKKIREEIRMFKAMRR